MTAAQQTEIIGKNILRFCCVSELVNIILWIGRWHCLDMDTEKLIEYIREHQEFYDLSHHKYCNKHCNKKVFLTFYVLKA